MSKKILDFVLIFTKEDINILAYIVCVAVFVALSFIVLNQQLKMHELEKRIFYLEDIINK